MDSITQIVLGAACGEAVAGRKLGRRAMLWGAVGGTIPDLDVLAWLFTDEINSASFHRGFMHSFVFAALAPWVFARGAQLFYRHNIHQRRGYKALLMFFWFLFYVVAAAAINAVPYVMGIGLRWWLAVPMLAVGIWFARMLWRDYWNRPMQSVEVGYGVWVSLFFWSIFTHPILDSFTNFGTQLFQPFSDYRVQWTSVSVVDFLYTVPFAICLAVAFFKAKTSRARDLWTWAGILWGCLYLGYTYWHKRQVGDIFEQSLQANGIAYERYMTGPTILNNIVWFGLAETDSAYVYGLYGFNDRRREFSPISVIPKNHDLLPDIPADNRALYFLRWFSNGYFNVMPYRGDTLQVNDLRFGLLSDSLAERNYVYSFLLFKNAGGEWDVHQLTRNREKMLEGEDGGLVQLWRRAVYGKP